MLKLYGSSNFIRKTYLLEKFIGKCVSTSQRSFASKDSASPFPSPHNKLPKHPARTRFAPSPTGYLHLGSLRTALYNYLLAKATGGQFLLRIEDTDQNRTVPGALERICRDLEWVGLHWDEGPIIGGPYGPYIQSERTHIYRQYADKLLESGHAYRCFCSAERLQELSQLRSKLGLATDYDRTCAGISKDESDERSSNGERHTVRLKAPDAYPTFDDLIYGRIGKPRREARKLTHGQQAFEDPILLKSDGRPTYHLANVVDDHLMKITHVVRAVEWMPSTPKHVYLYQAFGWRPPAFAHVGLLQGANNQKLSKRSGDIDVGFYRSSGVFPEALLNFVALLGWHHKQKSDLIELQEMVNLFDFDLTKGNTVVNFPKLDYLSREYTRKYIQEKGDRFHQMLQKTTAALKADGITCAPQGRDLEEYVSLILQADPTSYLDTFHFSERHRLFFERTRQDKAALNQPFANAEVLTQACQSVKQLAPEQWSVANITAVMQQTVSTYIDQQTGDVQAKSILSGLFSDLRQMLLAGRKGPGMAQSMEILGRDETLWRMENAGSFSRSIAG